MKSLHVSIAVSLTLVLSAGCASIVSKSEYPVSITSAPEGAEINVANGSGQTVHNGRTPTTVNLSARAGYFKGQDYTVTFQKEGYAPYTAQIVRDTDGWYILGNIVLGGLIGWLIVDPATGAMWTLNDLHVNLDPVTAEQQGTGVHILTLDEVPEELHSQLIRLQ